MKKKIGQVSQEEKEKILALFERRNGLSELTKVVKDDDVLYEKIVTDLGVTATKFQQWWDETAKKYQWENVEDGHWEINFETNEIYLFHG
jgi:CXXX repeat modification system protein